MAVDKRSARLGVLATVSVLLLGLLGARLWFLQGVQAEEYQARVTAAKTREVLIPPERGRIFDSDGRVLADNQRILTVTVEWSAVRKKSNRLELFERLSGPLKTPVDDLMRRYDPCYKVAEDPCTKVQLFDSLLPLPLKEDVSEDVVSFIKERQEDYPGVDVTPQYKRVYPYAPLAAHVVGYMGAIGANTLETYLKQGYKRNERVGQFGVELSLERELHGRWGKRVYEVDASGGIVRELEDQRIEPVAGNDIQLSIDLDIQQYAEQALETELRARRALPEDEKAIDRAPYNGLDAKTNFKDRIYRQKMPDGSLVDYPQWVQHKAPAGAVVVLDHTNGQVIAMASYPTFDNRWMESGITGSKYKELFPSTKPNGDPIDPDQSILVNRAVQGNYNLGSTIKPFVAWSAMHSGIITANDVFLDEGTYQLTTIPANECQNNGGLVRCIFKNATNRLGRPSSYGPVTVEDALAVSSDAFFYKIGEEMWLASEQIPGQEESENPENLLKTNLERFGFGNKTGIQLPYEWKGRIPDDAVKRDLVERNVLLPGETPRLLVGDNVQVAIGQGLMAATPLQSANAYATLANGGLLLQPSIIKAIYAPLTPDLGPAMADLAAGTVVKSFALPVVKDQLEMPPEVYNPIVAGLTRVIEGRGTTYPGDFYHATTGESLFKNYPVDIAGKTGTVQGAANLPWNDSSAFGAFGLTDDVPYTVFAFLEKAGYGSKAAAPVTKCMFLALTGEVPTDPVLVSDPLDITSTVAAPSQQLADTSCLTGSAGLKD
ncbi:MAG: penicillin-binding transpeptidase domain-containing protein [Actinomycetota bacterium]|nr:penicillin-binding transpeptidase domain-containing protein [Actinomycetota bacterium]